MWVAERVEAVSYTHLDVYKRQFIDIQHRNQIVVLEDEANLSPTEDGKPVSYTHLDVYKRQMTL